LRACRAECVGSMPEVRPRGACFVQDSERVYRRAMEIDQLSAANTAIKGKGILTGKWVEKAEIGSPGEYDSLSDDELECQLTARLAKLGFARVDALVDLSPSETDAEDAVAPPGSDPVI
jgi:hypothetical protein